SSNERSDIDHQSSTLEASSDVITILKHTIDLTLSPEVLNEIGNRVLTSFTNSSQASREKSSFNFSTAIGSIRSYVASNPLLVMRGLLIVSGLLAVSGAGWWAGIVFAAVTVPNVWSVLRGEWERLNKAGKIAELERLRATAFSWPPFKQDPEEITEYEL